MGTDDDDKYFTEQLNEAIDEVEKEAAMTPAQRKQAKMAEDKERLEREQELKRREERSRQLRAEELRQLQAQIAEEERREKEKLRQAQIKSRRMENIRRQAEAKNLAEMRDPKKFANMVDQATQEFLDKYEKLKDGKIDTETDLPEEPKKDKPTGKKPRYGNKV